MVVMLVVGGDNVGGWWWWLWTVVLVGGTVTWSRGLLISWETEIMSKEAENRHSDNFVNPRRFHLPLMSSNYGPMSRLTYCVGESLHDPITFKTHKLVISYHT